jgi:putative membrane protein
MKTGFANKMRPFIAIVAAAGLATFADAQEDALTKQDKEFLKKASELGMTETELGKLATQRGSSAEVKALGKKLAADHAKANADLEKLAKSKKVELKMDETLAQKQMISSFEKKSGAEFDKEFKEHVAKDHEKAIKTFSDAAKDTKDPDVKAFAEKNLESLKEHHSAAMKE